MENGLRTPNIASLNPDSIKRRTDAERHYKIHHEEETRYALQTSKKHT